MAATAGADLKTCETHLGMLDKFLDQERAHMDSIGLITQANELMGIITHIQDAFSAVEIAQARVIDIINEVGELTA